MYNQKSYSFLVYQHMINSSHPAFSYEKCIWEIAFELSDRLDIMSQNRLKSASEQE